MGFEIEEIDHIAIAVPDLDAAVHVATTVLGATLLWRHPPRENAINDGAVLDLGGMLIVFEHPLGDRGVFAEFLRRRGPGIHHIGVSVTNLDQAMKDAEADAVRLVNPALDNKIRREVLVHPKSGLGIVWQMIEWNASIRPDRQRRRAALRDGEFVVPGLSG
jgi:methylmalonyl-CoA/ethylmalonyl-CoA epimerase